MLLSAAIWIPIAGGMLVLWAGDQRPQLLRWLALIGSLLGFAVTIPLWTRSSSMCSSRAR